MYNKNKIFECVRFFLKMNIPVKALATIYQTHIQKELRLSSKTYSGFLGELGSLFKIKIPESAKKKLYNGGTADPGYCRQDKKSRIII